MIRIRMNGSFKIFFLFLSAVIGMFVFSTKTSYAITSVEQIIPTPQQVTYTENFLTLYNGSSFSAAIVKGKNASQTELDGVNLMQGVISRLTGANIPIINDTGNYSAYSVILSVGTENSNSLNASLINANSIVIPNNSEGYAIEKVTSGSQSVFVIAGKEAIGSYYGATSLSQMITQSGSNTRVRIISVHDYPSLKIRAVKDIYNGEGQFTYADDMEWMKMLAKLKMNVFSLCYTHLSATGWRNPSEDYIRAVKDLSNYERDLGTISLMQVINPGFTGGMPINAAEEDKLIRTYKYSLDEGGTKAMLGFDDTSGTTTANQHRDWANLVDSSYKGQDGFYLLGTPQSYSLDWPDPTPASYLPGFTNGLHPGIGAVWTGDHVWSSLVTPAMVNQWSGYTANPTKVPFYWHNDPVLQNTLLNTKPPWQPTQYYFADSKVPFQGVNLNGGYIWKNMPAYTSDGVIENIFRPSTTHKIYAISLADWMWNPAAYENTTNEFNRAKRYWDTIVSNQGFMKTATASSQYNTDYTPGLAVDGLSSHEVTENAWATGQNQTVNAWWKVDLGSKQDISGIQIKFRELASKSYMVPKTITFQVSNDNVNWSTLVSKATNVPTEDMSYDSSPYFYHFNANARYIKLLFEDGGQNNSATKLIELSEVEIVNDKDAIPAQQNIISLNTGATASSEFSSEYAANKAVDGIVSTNTVNNAWASSTSTVNAWWKTDLGGLSDIHGVDISFRQLNSAAYMVPKSITFQVSNDNTNWTTVLKKDTNVPLEGSSYSSTQTYHYDVRGKGKYIRLLFEDGSQNTLVELSEVTVNTDNLALRKTTSASSAYTGYGASLANDGLSSDTTTNNAWSTAAGSTINAWWKVDLGQSKDFKTLNVKFREFPAGQAYMVPKTITIQESDDNVTWITLLARSAHVPVTNGTASSETYQYSVNGHGRYVRLLFEDGGQDSLVQLSEVVITDIQTPEHQRHVNDIAYTKTATASSSFSSLYKADLANDGHTSREVAENAWATASGQAANSWWQVDLGQMSTISKVDVNYREFPYNIAYMVPKTVTFQVSNDNVNWTTVISKSTYVPTTGASYSSQPFTYSLNTSGRYMRLRFEDGGQDSLVEISEVEVSK